MVTSPSPSPSSNVDIDEKGGAVEALQDVTDIAGTSNAANVDSRGDMKASAGDASSSPPSKEVRVWSGSAVRDLCRAIVSHDFDRAYE
jgi:hypothetical protein